MLVVDGAAHGERAHVVEVDGRVGQRLFVDEARLVLRCEGMDAQGGAHGVVSALAAERYATDDVVALFVGLAVEAQLVGGGDDGGEDGVGCAMAVVLVGHARRLRVVVGEGQCCHALVHGPVEFQSCLRADEQTVVVTQDFLVSEHLRP